MSKDGATEQHGIRETLLENQQNVKSENFDTAAISTTSVGICQSNGYRVPGQVTFLGCTPSQLRDFAIIREPEGGTLTPILNNTQYSVEGFWWRHHLPKNEWYKIQNSCVMTVMGGNNGISITGCCKLGTGTGWSSEAPAGANPF